MRNFSRLILLLAILRFILPYLLQSPVYEPHRDEFLYLAEGRHLAWGYLEVPPLLSLFAWFTHLLGNSVFWIKFWPNLFGSLTFILCARIVTRAGGGRLALWLLFFVFIFGAWLRMFFLFQPNAPEIFFSALMAYSIFSYLHTSKNQFLYLFGIALGLGLLTKYTVAFWGVSIGAGLLLTREREIFLNRHFYFAIALAALIFLPNLLWQWSHNFPVFHHMKELRETQLEYISTGDFLKNELLMYLTVFYMWAAGLVFCFKRSGKRYRIFAFAFLAMQLLMIALHGKAYYTAGSFTIIFALGTVYLERFFLSSSAIFKYAALSFTILAGLLIWPLLLPVASPKKLASFYQKMNMNKTGLLKWEDLENHALPQDFADMLGWKEMAAGVAKAYSTLNAEEKKNVLIWCDNYGEAGAVNYYRNGFGYPEAYSSNGSFLFWLPSAVFPDNIILVADNDNALDDPQVMQFRSATVIDTVSNSYSREYKSTILVLKHPSQALKKGLKNEIESQRKIFQR